jgi:hypothetical protein
MRGPVAEVACEAWIAANEQPFADIDTPEEYRRLASE